MWKCDPTVVRFRCVSTSATCWRSVHPFLSKRHRWWLNQSSKHVQLYHGQGPPSMLCGTDIIQDHSPEKIIHHIWLNTVILFVKFQHIYFFKLHNYNNWEFGIVITDNQHSIISLYRKKEKFLFLKCIITMLLYLGLVLNLILNFFFQNREMIYNKVKQSPPSPKTWSKVHWIYGLNLKVEAALNSVCAEHVQNTTCGPFWKVMKD